MLKDGDDIFEELSLLMGDDIESNADQSQSNLLVAKFVVPVQQNCRLCGEWINGSQEWLNHHQSEKHRKVIRCLSLFRSKCIEHHNDDAEPTTKAIANDLRQKIQFTQELFEAPSTSNLICGVCGSSVFDVESHLSSVKHNEAYINQLYIDDFVSVKEKCVTPTGICWREYEKNLIERLQQTQPRTDDSPLEIYVLKDDQNFIEWMCKYMIALSNYTQPKESQLSYHHALELIVPVNVLQEKIIEESFLFRNDSCSICRSKHFSLDSFKKHASSEGHIQKLKLFDFLRFAEKFKLVSGACSEQNRIDSSNEPTLGSEYITEFIDKCNQKSFWICAVCFVISEAVAEIFNHVISTKHLMNCLNMNYPDIKLTPKNSREMGEDVKRYATEIRMNRTAGKIRLAELIDIRMESVFIQLGVSRKAEVDVPNSANINVTASDLENSVPEDEKEPKILFSDRNEEMLWCSICSMMIPVKKTDVGTKFFWWQHVKTNPHMKKREIRKEFEFDKKNFVTEKYLAANIREILAKKDITLLGLESVIERKIKTKDGTPVHDCVCLLCAEKFHVSTFTSHVTSKQHILQFIHKNEQNLAHKILNEKHPGVQQKLIDEYVAKKKSTRETVRVYNPAQADLNKADYERLKQEIAEKERLLEQKRREREKEEEEKRRIEETKRLAELENEKKRKEEETIVELKRQETARQVEEERQRLMQEKALAQLEKVKEEQQQRKARQKMEQQRLLDMMQREQQNLKETERAKVEQQRIYDLMQKERAKLEEEEKKRAGIEDNLRNDNEQSNEQKLLAAALNITKNIPRVPKSPTTTDVTADKIASTAVTSSSPLQKFGETKWVPLAQTETQRAPITSKSDVATTVVSQPPIQTDAPDALIELLSKSAMLPIVSPDAAYIHKELMECVEPLVGLQHVNEFECIDTSYEPGYFCRMCSVRKMAKDLIPHVTSSDHRMKYFAQSYNPFWQNIMMTYTNPGARAAVIKQYAGQVERQEGRKNVEFRLTMRVSNTVLSTKRPAISNLKKPDTTTSYTLRSQINDVQYFPPPIDTSQPPPSLIHTRTLGMANMDVCPPGISPPLPTTTITTTTTTTTTTEYNPIVVSNAPHQSSMSIVEQTKLKSSHSKTERPIGPRDASWNDKCNKFLKKLTGQDNSKMTVSKESDKADKKSSPIVSIRKSGSHSHSRSRSRSRSVDRRQKSSSRYRRTSPPKNFCPNKVSQSSPSTSSRKISDNKTKSGRDKSIGGKRDRSPRRSHSPVIVELKRSRTSDITTNKPIDDIPVFSPEDILILQRLADANPQALERLVMENPSIMAALLLEQNKIAQSPVVTQTSPQPLPPVFAPSQSQALAFARQPSESFLLKQFSTSQQQQLPNVPPFFPPLQQPAVSLDPNALLVNLLQEEVAKQSKVADEQQRLLLALLQMTAANERTSAVAQSALPSASTKYVFDYSHGLGATTATTTTTTSSGGGSGSSSAGLEERGKTFEIDDLIKEASANVQQAQRGKQNPPPVGARQSIYGNSIASNRQVEETAERWRELANDRSFFEYKDSKPPMSQKSISMQRQQQSTSFDQQQQQVKMKEVERRRKELFGNLPFGNFEIWN